MRFDFSTLMGEGKGPLRIFGNLPYNISTPLIFHLCEFADRVEDMHFMLQKEVVLRLAAGPGSKAYGRLSVMTQYYCRGAGAGSGPGCLQTGAESGLCRSSPDPHKNPTIVAKDIRCLNRVCTEGFGQRRKTIRNSFSNFITDAQLTELGIDGNLRPENLSLEQFVMIANWLADQQQA